MKFFDIDQLVRDNKQENLYNFFSPTYKDAKGYKLTKYIVNPEDEMRPDLICQKIYGTTDYVDVLLDINGIDNPLNVKKDDELLYPEISAIDIYRITAVDNNDKRAQLLNPNKSTKRDTNRKKYVEDNFALPPNALPTPDSSVKIENNQIVIG